MGLPSTVLIGTVESIDIPQTCIPFFGAFGVPLPYRATANYVIRVQSFNTSGGPPTHIGSMLSVTYSYATLPEVQPGDQVRAYGWFYATVDAGCDSTIRIGPSINGSNLTVLRKADFPQPSAIHYHNYTLPFPLLEITLNARNPPNPSHLTIWVNQSSLGYYAGGLPPTSDLEKGLNATGWIVVPKSAVATIDNTTRTAKIELDLNNVTHTSDQIVWKINLTYLLLPTKNWTISSGTLVASWDDFGYSRIVVALPQDAYDLRYDPVKRELSYQSPGIPGFGVESILFSNSED